LGLLVTLLGRRFGAGWRSHAQRIMVGLSTVALEQLAMRRTFQAISTHSVIHTQAEYDRLLALRDKLIHANDVIYLCVLLWWIACLWIDEPAELGATSSAADGDQTIASGDEAAAALQTDSAIGETSGELGPDSRKD
jgi:hypothetical protein